MGKVFQKVKREQAITHKIMSAIRSKDTKMEIVLRKELWHRGLRYRKNYKKLPGITGLYGIMVRKPRK